MKALFALSLVASALCMSFDEFATTFNKQYSPAERAAREVIFQQNMATVQQLNEQADGGATFGVTKFMDLTTTEWARMYTGGRPAPHNAPVKPAPQLSATAMPASVDWVAKGATTKVKDQGQCGSCWAFSTVEEIESMWFLAGNTLTEFSTQQVVSCDKGTGNWTDEGCNGGFTEGGYNYVKKAGGLETEADYPYKSGDGITGKCKEPTKIAGGQVDSFYYATPACYGGSCHNQNETDLQAHLTEQPVSVCLNAAPWQFYSGGVMTQAQCKPNLLKVDHCVQLVGYQTGGAKDYWVVRNSWNTDWGNKGYIYLSMKENTCGVMDDATIPNIKK